MSRRLRISTIADLDLVHIYDSIAVYNVRAADRLIERIKCSCRELVDQPNVGSLCGERYPGLRFRVAGEYVIYYRVYDDSIWIQRIIHGARDASRLL